MDVDRFMRGFDQPGPARDISLARDPIWEQLDALRDERAERGDPHWSPPGRDPEALERLVEERRARRRA
jgi:hypothetical protein